MILKRIFLLFIPRKPRRVFPKREGKDIFILLLLTLLIQSFFPVALASETGEDIFPLHRDDKQESERMKQIKMIYARIYSRLGRIEEAIREYEELMAEYPEDVEIEGDFAEALIEHKMYQGARSVINSLLNKEPKSEQGLRLLGRLYHEIGDYRRASEIYREILKMRPDDVDLTMDLASCLNLWGNWAEALPLCQITLEEDEGNRAAIELEREILQLHAPNFQFKRELLQQPGISEQEDFVTTFQQYLSNDTYYRIGFIHSNFYLKESEFVDKIDESVQTFSLSLNHNPYPRLAVFLGLEGYLKGRELENSFNLGGDFRSLEKTDFHLSYHYRKLWTSPPEAVANDGFLDRLSVNIDYFLTEKILLQGNLTRTDYFIDRDKRFGEENSYFLRLGYRFSEEPTLTTSYQIFSSDFSYKKLSFQDKISLLREEDTHSLSLLWGHQINNHLRYEAEGAVRRDFAREKPSLDYEFTINLNYKLSSAVSFGIRYNYSNQDVVQGVGSTSTLSFSFNHLF